MVFRMDSGEEMNTSEDFILVFDSGVGGISVLRQLRKLMPEEKFIYFGDSANAPYGSRPTQEVRELTLAAAKRITDAYPVKAIVVACNTATAAAIEQLRDTYCDRIVVGIEPALKLAVDRHPFGRIGVMATEVTLREEKFDHLAHRFDEKCRIEKISAPGLVERIEAGCGDSEETQLFLRNLLAPYIGKLDALVLGCTHYPFVKHNIQSILGEQTEVVHGGEGTARETMRRLRDAGLLRHGSGETQIFNSSDDPHLITLSKNLLEH